MTGPEHFAEAERLIAMARKAPLSHELYSNYEAQATLILADAQVHATLALSAATAVGAVAETEPDPFPEHVPKSGEIHRTGPHRLIDPPR
ncbi:MAG: hypothetical protein ACRDOA_08005 [Streptosporangiaceae bacterium]